MSTGSPAVAALAMEVAELVKSKVSEDLRPLAASLLTEASHEPFRQLTIPAAMKLFNLTRPEVKEILDLGVRCRTRCAGPGLVRIFLKREFEEALDKWYGQ